MQEILVLTPMKQSQNNENQPKIRQINNYIQNRVMPILGPLQIQLLMKRPVNIKQYCMQWLKKYNRRNEDPRDLFSDQQSEEVFLQKRRKMKGRRKNRKGVSGDSTQSYHKLIQKMESNKHEVNWNEQTKITLMMYLKKCIFFAHLSHQSLLRLISKIRQKIVEKGQIILREGESGDILYIVLQGKFKCEKIGSSQILKQYKAGEIFGELALLYSHPRASTITAVTSGKLFQLDRQEFNLVLRGKMLDKLHQCEKFVDKIPFLKDLDIYQKTKLFQTLEESIVPADKYIIKEGELGNRFYIVAQGQLVAYKAKDGENKLVYAYKKGDYFGEIALLKNIPRQASIKSLTEVRLYFINRQSFMKIIGPLQGILSRSCEKYAIWDGQLSGEGQL